MSGHVLRENECFFFSVYEAREGDDALALPDDLLKRCEAARAEWEAVQDELAAIYIASGAAERERERMLAFLRKTVSTTTLDPPGIEIFKRAAERNLATPPLGSAD